MKKFFIAIIIVCILIQMWLVYVTYHFPYIGIYLEQDSQKNWIISSFEKTSPDLKNKINIGDIIVQIDDRNTEDYLTVKSWKTIDEASSLTISRNGMLSKVQIGEQSHWTQLNVISIFGEAVSLFFALLIYLKCRNSQSARLLAYAFFTIASIYISLGAANRGDALGKIVIFTAMMLLPIVFLHFLIVFFREKGNIYLSSRYLSALYGIVILVALSKFVFFFPDLAYPVYQYSSLIAISFFLLGLIINFVVIFIVLSKYRKTSEYISKITKTIFFSMFIAFFPFACLSFMPLLLIQKSWIDPLYTGCAILIFPISFAYLIISKQIYDIDLVLRRLFFTAITSIVPSIIIVSLNAIIFKADTSLGKLTINFVVVLIILSFILYGLEYFTSKFESVVFPRKHHLQSALRKISKNLGSISSFREMKEIILVDIVQTLQVYGGAIVFKYAHHMETISEGDIHTDDIEKLLEMGSFEDHPDYTCFEINHHEEYTSYLVMTRKRTNTMLGLEDRQWLNLIISYLAVSLENIYLIRKLTMRMEELASLVPNKEAGEDFVWFRKLMFELQEKERVRIATDLHDTTMQDLFFLKKRFASIMDNLKLTKAQQTQFQSIVEFVEIINTNLRQSCFDLHPHLLQEIGFIRTVEKLVERESYESSFDIQFGTDNAYSIEYRDLDTKRHLFRMVQELITNAKKHSQASKVSIQLVSNNDIFSLLYEDNGVGFDEAQMIRKEIGSTGIGMEQIKSRTLHLNGRFVLQTSKSKGVKIQITIPLRGGLPA